MKCEDCIDKKSKPINNAEYVLVDYDSLKLLCQSCLNEYCHIEGEMNLDFYSLNIGLSSAFKRIDEILKYNGSRYSHLLREYSALKKLSEDSEEVKT